MTIHYIFYRIEELFILAGFIAGWSSLAARVAHNHEVVGSNPTPATKRSLNVERKLNIGDRYVLFFTLRFLFRQVMMPG